MMAVERPAHRDQSAAAALRYGACAVNDHAGVGHHREDRDDRIADRLRSSRAPQAGQMGECAARIGRVGGVETPAVPQIVQRLTDVLHRLVAWNGSIATF